jgi:hypothetical protein
MTTPSAPQPPGEPEYSAAATPPAETPADAGSSAAATPPTETPADAGSSASGPTPERDPSAPSSDDSRSAGSSSGSRSRGNGSPGFFAANRLILLGGGGGAVVAIVVVVVLLFTMGIFGGGGGGGGVGGSSDAIAYILEDSDATDMEIVDVTSILGAAEIPAGLQSDLLDTPSTVSFDDPEDWKDEWKDRDWSDSLPVPSWLFSDVGIEDLDTVVTQSVDGSTGYVLAGNFSFDDLRETMEDEDWEEDDYREFEVWDDRNVALLEDNGVILLGRGFVSAVLKALDTGRGLMEGDSAMQRVLDQAGSGLIVIGATENCRSFGSPRLRSCDAFAMTVTGGTPDATQLRAAFLFSSESRAESGLDDIEEALLDTNDVDADIEDISADGEFVTYEVTIHEE